MSRRLNFLRTTASAAAISLLASCAGTSVSEFSEKTVAGKANEKPLVTASLAYTLPRTIVDVFKEAKGYSMSTRTVQDRQHNYLINYEPSAISNDSWDISVDDSTGYISGINTSFEDRTVEILKKAAGSAAKLSLLTGGAPKVPDFSFDPSDPVSFAGARARFNADGVDLACAGACGVPAKPVAAVTDNVLYRFPLPMILLLCPVVNGGGCDANAATQEFPLRNLNASPLLAIPAPRSPLVKRTLAVTFTAGIPTKVVHNKPSEIEALVALPGDIVGAVFGGITAGFTSQRNAIAAETNFLKAQTEQIAAVNARVDAIIDQMQRNQPASVTGSPAIVPGTVPPTGDQLPNLE